MALIVCRLAILDSPVISEYYDHRENLPSEQEVNSVPETLVSYDLIAGDEKMAY